mgnify:FL=1
MSLNPNTITGQIYITIFDLLEKPQEEFNGQSSIDA